MSYLIKHLPDSEKPRERFSSVGVENLSNEELIAILIRTGIKNIGAKEVALNTLKSVKKISDFQNININYLASIKGLGSIKAMVLICAIEFGKRVMQDNNEKQKKLNNAREVYQYFKKYYHNAKQEKLIAVYLDVKKNILGYDTVFIGTINKSVAHPREIFKKAILNNASAIIIIHNHPSGDVTPSNEDTMFTNQMLECGKIMGIYLIDHLIFGHNNYYSYMDNR